jgi:hypothetical protein
MDRLRIAARLVLPAIWLGLIMGISLIEAPLKFQAPGITIPLGLGIGRLVFTAMNVVELVLAGLLLLSLVGQRVDRRFWALVGGAVVVLVAKVMVIRPLLNRQTDLVLTGADDGGSALHYLYIAADGVLIILLVLMLITAARRWVPTPALEPERRRR